MRQLLFSVYPRYTAGSPAGVNRELAERVLREEADAIKWCLIGYQGEAAKLEAETKGLAGIAIERWEVRNTLFERDLATREVKQYRIKHGRVLR